MLKVCMWGVAVCVMAGTVACGGGGETRAAEGEAPDEGRVEAWLEARMVVRAGWLAVATGWNAAKSLPRLLRGHESHAGGGDALLEEWGFGRVFAPGGADDGTAASKTLWGGGGFQGEGGLQGEGGKAGGGTGTARQDEDG
ncbi:MAG: hypothetical protein IK066_01535 [Kiritimatiellae bacterium]|nr:hypothetical protein [Kiritimatiellia bacterium]